MKMCDFWGKAIKEIVSSILLFLAVAPLGGASCQNYENIQIVQWKETANSQHQLVSDMTELSWNQIL